MLYEVKSVMKANASLIAGPSAGAAMAIGTVLAMHNMTAKKGVAITGAIDSNGTITPVGPVAEKAAAAKDAGMSLFLVPEGESYDKSLKRSRECTNIEGFRVCKVRYSAQKTSISSDLGIKIEEVQAIRDALEYFRPEEMTG